jgi:hypothetical protein
MLMMPLLKEEGPATSTGSDIGGYLEQSIGCKTVKWEVEHQSNRCLADGFDQLVKINEED